MFIEFNTETIKLEAGEMIVVPKGTEHRPFANDEASMVVEPRGIVNTGDKIDELTAQMINGYKMGDIIMSKFLIAALALILLGLAIYSPNIVSSTN